MKANFLIKNIILDRYYGWNEQWNEDCHMAREFATKEDAIDYASNNSLGYCTIIEVYKF